jgi:hypothetical protein
LSAFVRGTAGGCEDERAHAWLECRVTLVALRDPSGLGFARPPEDVASEANGSDPPFCRAEAARCSLPDKADKLMNVWLMVRPTPGVPHRARCRAAPNRGIDGANDSLSARRLEYGDQDLPRGLGLRRGGVQPFEAMLDEGMKGRRSILTTKAKFHHLNSRLSVAFFSV